MAVSYFTMGKKKLYVMNSNMDASEGIEPLVQKAEVLDGK
jgi:hypothetical protein